MIFAKDTPVRIKIPFGKLFFKLVDSVHTIMEKRSYEEVALFREGWVCKCFLKQVG